MVMKNSFILAVLAAGTLFSCSSSQTSRFMNQEFDDDLYFVSSGRALIYAEESARVSVRESDGQPDDAYNEYLSARRGNNAGVSPYDNERAYDRNMRRHADPMWSSPSMMGFGGMGFFGMRSYMLYNPFFPPFWSMQPGFSLGWNSWGGMHMGMGMGMGMNPWMMGGMGMNPWMMGMYDPWMMGMGMYDPWMMGGMGMWNPYMGWGMNPWMNPWGPGMGWATTSPVNRLPVAPARGSRVGGSLPSQASLFNPNPGRNRTGSPTATGNRVGDGQNVRTAPGAGMRPGTTSPGRERVQPGEQRGTTAPVRRESMQPGTVPSRGSVNNPGRQPQMQRGQQPVDQTRPMPAPSRRSYEQNNFDRRNTPGAVPAPSRERFNPAPAPSRGGNWGSPSSGGGSGLSQPSRGGGGSAPGTPSGGSRPSSGGRPR
jgi:hypothetical protein